MKIDTLNERISNATEKIAKKEKTICKKKVLIEKKIKKLKTFGVEVTANKYDCENEAYWLLCDIDNLMEDIARGQKEITLLNVNLEKYQEQMKEAENQESILANEVPDSIKQMQEELVKQWNMWDIERRNNLQAYYKEFGYSVFIKNYIRADYEFRCKTDEQIHKQNTEDAKVLVLDLFHRVKSLTGEIKDWSGVHAQHGTHGMIVLNGLVVGKKGTARVESIVAGGYNIQRLHIRVLVK